MRSYGRKCLGRITAIYNLLDGYAQAMKSSIILVHHTSKGNQANKSVTDLGSGAGAQSRSPDTHLTLRQHQEDGVVSVFCCVRSFPPVESFCLRRVSSPGEPLAFCADCHEWTPMQWLPIKERGKRAEQWFQCEYCHERNLTLRYLSAKEAVPL